MTISGLQDTRAGAVVPVREVGQVEQWLTVAAAVGCGAMGGVFFAFSSFVMAGLRRLAPPDGIRAMQSINVTAPRAPLMALMVGTALLCAGLAVRAGFSWGDQRAVLLVVAAGLYLVGVVVLTGGYHVPRNDQLALLDPSGPEAGAAWQAYLTDWTAWNHVRAASGLAAAAAYAAALLR
jgi:uncharacterized membrane protein